MLEVLAANDPAALERAAIALASGLLVVVPTETVYGLAADASDDDAVASIYVAKGRPTHNPLIVHCADADAARRLGVFDARADKLASAFWPGPLTMVLPRHPDARLADAVTAGLPSVALRVPHQSSLQTLLRLCRRPLAAPSANRSGHLSPTRAVDAAADLADAADIDCVLDGGPCTFGLESTIVAIDADGVRLLRPGALDVAAIEAVVGPLLVTAASGEAEIRAPGMSLRHYAPSLPVRLDASAPVAGEAWLVYGQTPWDAVPGDLDALVTTNLSPGGSIAEAASRLFAAMRDVDDPGRYTGIAIAPLPTDGIGAAMHDRLRRAAAASAPMPRLLVMATSENETIASVLADCVIPIADVRLDGGRPDVILSRLLAAEPGVSPSQVLFVDRDGANVEAARTLGWQAERIDAGADGALQLRALLGARGLLRPPSNEPQIR